jgi:ribosome-associated toxin RatA of RatAB toxin-antitoxin module
MATFSRSIHVQAPRAFLFHLMQDYARRLEWDPFLSAARLVNAETAGLGARAWCVDRAGRGMETEYVSFDPPSRVAVRMTRGPWFLDRFAGSWRYEELTAASTRVVFRYHVKTKRWLLGSFGERMIERAFARSMDERLETLKERLEHMACTLPAGESRVTS